MFCQNCNAEIPDNATYCENCGVGFNLSAVQKNDKENTCTNVIHKIKNSKILKITIACTLVIIILFALAVGVKIIKSQSQHTSDVTNKASNTSVDMYVVVTPVSGAGGEMFKSALLQYGAVDSSGADIGIYKIYVGGGLDKEGLERIARELRQNKMVQSAYVEDINENN